MKNKKIFISYSWSDEAEVKKIDSYFARLGINLIRDNRDLKYNSNIHNFMKSIGDADKIILYISENYLKSVNCMFEASEALEKKDKIVIIVKKDTQLHDVKIKNKLIEYWSEKYSEIKKYDGISYKNEIEDTKRALNTIDKFINYLKTDKRMEDGNLDFDELLNILEIKKEYPQTINKDVYDWIRKYNNQSYSAIVNLIYDLNRSVKITFSGIPNCPDKETCYNFKQISFDKNIYGISVKIDTIESIPLTYPCVINIEKNSMDSEIHAKYYFECENISKKKQYNDLLELQKHTELNAHD